MFLIPLFLFQLFEDKRHYYIVTGVSEGGDLHRELKTRGKFEEKEAAILIKQILVCVNYCHRHNVIHRDLKPGNILLEGHKRLEHIKVIDFGEAVIATPTEKLTEITGTMSYVSVYLCFKIKLMLFVRHQSLSQNRFPAQIVRNRWLQMYWDSHMDTSVISGVVV